MSKRIMIFRPPFLIGLSTLATQMLWWLGWNPGLASSDVADELAQAQSGVILNLHPAAHTLYLAVLSGMGEYPEVVTLFQIAWYSILVAMAYVVLDWVAVPFRLVVCAFLAIVPTVSVTLLTFSEDVPFSLLAFGLLLLLIEAQYNPHDFWHRHNRVILVGVSMAGMALMRHNGFLTVVLLAVLMMIVWHDHFSRVVASITISVILLVGMAGPVYNSLGVDGGSIPPARVFLPDLARAYIDHGDSFTSEELAALERIAPLDVWVTKYNCTNTTPFLLDEEFDTRVFAEAPTDYIELGQDLFGRFPEAVVAHRLCASSYLYLPFQSADVQYPRVIPQSNPALVIHPLVEEARILTKPVYIWMEQPSNFWSTWSPALGVMLGLAAALVLMLRTKWRMPALLFLIHLGNVVTTSPAHGFRYALPLYLMAPVLMALVLGSFRKSRGTVPTLLVNSTLLGPHRDKVEPKVDGD